MNDLVNQYLKIESSLALSGTDILVSEVHGTVVGAIANHMKSAVTPDLLKLVEPGADRNDGRFARLTEVLNEVYRDNSELLLDGQNGFELLLPDDDESLSVRVEALAGWTKGYLLGLLYNSTFSIDQIPEIGPEIARDFMQIAEAASGVDDEEQEGWAMGELEEYIKVGAQLIFEFIYSERASQAPAAEQ